jgi:hypothetical protein
MPLVDLRRRVGFNPKKSSRHIHVNSMGNSRKKQFYLAGILLTAIMFAFWLSHHDFLSVGELRNCWAAACKYIWSKKYFFFLILHYSIKCTVDDVMNGAGFGNYVSLGINIATIVCYLLMPVALRFCGVGTGNKKIDDKLVILYLFSSLIFLCLNII